MNNKKYKTSKITKEEMNELTNRIDEGLVKFIKEGKYKAVLMSIGNLSNYSLNNQLYILMQDKNAKTIYGIKKWNTLGRRIKEGEKALKIFAPIIKRIDDSDEEVKVLGYKRESVFDISQTEGKELNVFKFDETIVVDNKNIIIDSLKDTIAKYGFSVNFVPIDELGEGVFGLCNHKDKVIKISDNLSNLQEISTLVHECGHALAHHEKRVDFKGLTKKEMRQIKEVEAESISCIVSSYLGLNTQNFNFSYITAWSNANIILFRRNLDLISKYAKVLIDGINSEFEKSIN